MQLILVLETTAKAKTDYIYIKSVFDYYYENRSVKLTPIYAKCKHELINQSKKIEREKALYKGKSIVIICADYDREGEKINKDIIKYAKNNNCQIVWFNRNIEEVFLHRTVDKDKTIEAIQFSRYRNTLVPKLSSIDVSNPLSKRPSSNILVIFDLYLNRKNINIT
ncbi:MAG: hypothetical protein IJ186_02125 [Bacilli bacterium]|nr:hypothetical protein [Bacilli bacterium]